MNADDGIQFHSSPTRASAGPDQVYDAVVTHRILSSLSRRHPASPALATVTSGGTSMKIKRYGSAVWSGGLKDGRGAISTHSGALKDQPYGFANRFEGVPGTNPEELLGAAHSACFTMALSLILGDAGFTATKMETKATVTLEPVDGGFAITAIALALTAEIPEIDPDTFQQLAGVAKANCPVSKLLNADISLTANLV